MEYCLYINTPDGNGEKEEFYNTVQEAQDRKDYIMGMPWLTDQGMNIYLADEDGNEVELK